MAVQPNNTVTALAVDYVDEELENIHPPTVFRVRPLTNGETFGLHRLSYGERNKKILEYGLIGWRNLLPKEVEQGSELAYSKSVLSIIPYALRNRLADLILRISNLSEKLEEELRSVVRSSYLIANVETKDNWDCLKCAKIAGLRKTRRCPLDYEPIEEVPLIHEIDVKYLQPWDLKNLKAGKIPTWLNCGQHDFQKCPIGLQTDRSREWVNLTAFCEAANCLPFDPPVWAAQPVIYSQVAGVVRDERNQLQQKHKTEDENIETEDLTKYAKSSNDMTKLIKSKVEEYSVA